MLFLLVDNIFYIKFSTMTSGQKRQKSKYSGVQKECYTHVVEKIMHNFFETLNVVVINIFDTFLKQKDFIFRYNSDFH